MKIVTKILLLMVFSIAFVMGGVSYLIIKQTHKVVYNQIDRLITTNLEYAKDDILEITEDIKQATEVVARHPEISKSFYLQMSRGINRILNEMVVIYPFYNYIMIVEPNGEIFAASTRDGEGNKVAGEQLLGLNFRENTLFSEPSSHKTIIGNPGDDPFLSMIDLKSGLSQWFIAPVMRRGELMGWVVVSYDWQNEILALLDEITKHLIAVGNPTIEAVLTDENGNIVVSTGSTGKNFVPSPDKIWKEKLLTFGNTTMVMIIANDKTKTNEPVINTRNYLLTIIISSTLLLVVILYFLLQKILLKRLSALHAGTIELGKGNLAHRLSKLGYDEIGELAETLNQMAQSLEEAQKELVGNAMESGMAQMSSMVLHNIGNAITPVTVHMDDLKKRELEEISLYLEKCYCELKDHIHELQHFINDEARGQEVFSYMGSLVDHLKTYDRARQVIINKIEGAITYISEILSYQYAYAAGKQETKQSTDLNSLIKDAIRMQERVLETKKISIKSNLDTKIPKLLIDKSRLIQVLVNLIKNSYEAIEALQDDIEKEIVLYTFSENGRPGFEITDNGIGIEPGKIDKVVEFGKSQKGSSGFGLYYCKLFVEANNGVLNIRSPGKGQGATVRVVFEI
jgi:signal transduction histidine kinase